MKNFQLILTCNPLFAEDRGCYEPKTGAQNL